MNVATKESMPDERQAYTRKFVIDGCDFYATVGFYPDGRVGEIFITIGDLSNNHKDLKKAHDKKVAGEEEDQGEGKMGSIAGGLADVLATTASVALQHGMPLKKLVEKWVNVRFEPCGETNVPGIQRASSVIDAIARWLAAKFLSPNDIPPGINPLQKGDE